MRVLVVVAIVCALGACGSSSTKPVPARVDVHVDKRVGLLALLQRLADAPEYVGTPTTSYVSDVTKTFGPFRSTTTSSRRPGRACSRRSRTRCAGKPTRRGRSC